MQLVLDLPQDKWILPIMAKIFPLEEPAIKVSLPPEITVPQELKPVEAVKEPVEAVQEEPVVVEEVKEEPTMVDDISPKVDKGVLKKMFIDTAKNGKQDKCKALLADYEVDNLTALFGSGADLNEVYSRLKEIQDA